MLPRSLTGWEVSPLRPPGPVGSLLCGPSLTCPVESWEVRLEGSACGAPGMLGGVCPSSGIIGQPSVQFHAVLRPLAGDLQSGRATSLSRNRHKGLRH